MSKLDTRLTNLLPEMTVKDKAKLFLQLKNSVGVTEEARLFQHDSLSADYERLYESIQGKDIPLVQRQQKEFKFLTNLIWEAESWLRDNLRETRLILLGVGLAFLGYLVVKVGPATVLGSFQALSWRFLIVVWFPFALITVLDTLGWRYAFRRDLTPFTTFARLD